MNTSARAAEKKVLDHLNLIARKTRKIANDRKKEDKTTCLEDVWETIQLELEDLPHGDLLALSVFCTGICVAIGPTKLRKLMSINEEETGKENES